MTEGRADRVAQIGGEIIPDRAAVVTRRALDTYGRHKPPENEAATGKRPVPGVGIGPLSIVLLSQKIRGAYTRALALAGGSSGPFGICEWLAFSGLS